MRADLSLAYWMDFSRGKPREWKAIRQSQMGHFSTGSFTTTGYVFFRDNSTEEMDHKKQKLAVCSSVPLAKKVKYSRGGEGTRIRAASEQT